MKQEITLNLVFVKKFLTGLKLAVRVETQANGQLVKHSYWRLSTRKKAVGIKTNG
jgi:hypothetical protein